MFCHKCGQESPEGSAFCQKCGEKLITDATASQVSFVPMGASLPITNTAAPVLASTNPRKSRLPIWIAVVVILIIIIAVAVGSSNDGGDDPYVQIVRGGTLEAYPQMTVGEAFDNFLSNPEWESGVSEDGETLVNVTGKALYLDEEADFVVQFIVNEDDETFVYNALEINGLPQINLIYWDLLDSAYSEESVSAAETLLDTSVRSEAGVLTTDEMQLLVEEWLMDHPLWEGELTGVVRGAFQTDEIFVFNPVYDGITTTDTINVDPSSGTLSGVIFGNSASTTEFVPIDEWYQEVFGGVPASANTMPGSSSDGYSNSNYIDGNFEWVDMPTSSVNTLVKGGWDFDLEYYQEPITMGSIIEGTVRNISGKTFSYAQIMFALYDSQGNQIGSAYANINNLSDGNTWRFQASCIEDNVSSFEFAGIDAW